MNGISLVNWLMKEYVRCEVKPRTKEKLVQGIQEFWETVDVAKCNKYVNHLKKVVPRVIELNGAATGYLEIRDFGFYLSENSGGFSWVLKSPK